jgi:hypothetical protein
MCAVERMLREGERGAGVCMHERKLALATEIRGLCGCKRQIEIVIHYKSGFGYWKKIS